jgi:thioredoxin family protein
MESAIQEVGPRFAERIHFVSCDSDAEPGLCRRCEVSNIPFLAVFIGGRKQTPIVGLNTRDALAAQIELRLAAALEAGGSSNSEAQPMHLSVDGLVNYGSKSGSGQLLFTDRSLFVLRPVENSSMIWAHAFGVVGALIWRHLDSRRPIPPPDHLADPELAQLDDKRRKQLLKTTFVAKVPLEDIRQVKNTRLGYEFVLADEPQLSYSGWLQKKRIREFLEGHGILIEGS